MDVRDFSYDGTIEGYLSVVSYCIENKTMPRKITAETFERDDGLSVRIRSDYNAADRLYKLVGRRASAEVQQMICDLFLTCVTDMEMDLFIMICKGIKYGAVIADDYSDELMRRIQFSIRDLYREAASVLSSMNAVKIDNVTFAVINPRNRVLPIIYRNILNNEDNDDVLIYDKRHKMALIRMGETDMIFDTGRIAGSDLGSVNDLYGKMWPYFASDLNTLGRQVLKERADSLSKLWYIAV